MSMNVNIDARWSLQFRSGLRARLQLWLANLLTNFAGLCCRSYFRMMDEESEGKITVTAIVTE